MTTGPAPELRPVVAQEMPRARTAASTVFALRGVYHDYWHYGTSVVMLSSRFSVVQQRMTTGGAGIPSDTAGAGSGGD